MSVVIEEFKGFPVLKIEEEDVNGYVVRLSFGLTKAKLIIDNLDTRKEFINNYDGV